MIPVSFEPQTMHRITVSAVLPECEEPPPHELELPEEEYEYTLVDCKVNDALGAAGAKTKLGASLLRCKSEGGCPPAPSMACTTASASVSPTA